MNNYLLQRKKVLVVAMVSIMAVYVAGLVLPSVTQSAFAAKASTSSNNNTNDKAVKEEHPSSKEKSVGDSHGKHHHGKHHHGKHHVSASSNTKAKDIKEDIHKPNQDARHIPPSQKALDAGIGP